MLLVTRNGAGFTYDTPTPTIFDIVFGGGRNGTGLNVSDIGSLFQDAAGTTPVTSDLDPVGLIVDRSGNGTNAQQADNTKRPKYRTGGGKPYLEFSSNAWLEFALGELNFANVASHIGVQSLSGLRSILTAPHHPTTHVSPFFRWSFWHETTNQFDRRFNGVRDFFSAAGVTSAPIHLGWDTVAGDYYRNSTVTGTFTPVAITYPNVTKVRIGANGGNGELANMRFYGAIVADDGLTALENIAVGDWLQSLF